jgi:hypothetical protein
MKQQMATQLAAAVAAPVPSGPAALMWPVSPAMVNGMYMYVYVYVYVYAALLGWRRVMHPNKRPCNR